MASVSETGATAGVAGAELAGAEEDGEAATGTGCTTFCRTAMYAPPAAAVRHPAAKTPARTLELIGLTPEQGRKEQLLCPAYRLEERGNLSEICENRRVPKIARNRAGTVPVLRAGPPQPAR
jgi:hypothetical protein